MFKCLKVIYNPIQKRFIAAEGAEIFKEDYVYADKWNCRVRYDGNVKCTACDSVNGKYYELCLKISPRGLVTISNVEGGTRNYLKSFRIKGWPCNGVIKLTGGPIQKRNAYYINVDFYK